MKSFGRTWPSTRGISVWGISPRMFEAAALRTSMILLTGRYSGLIQPGEHNVELKKDFSNVEDVLRQVEDIPALRAVAERAYHHLVASGAHSYCRFLLIPAITSEGRLIGICSSIYSKRRGRLGSGGR